MAKKAEVEIVASVDQIEERKIAQRIRRLDREIEDAKAHLSDLRKAKDEAVERLLNRVEDSAQGKLAITDEESDEVLEANGLK